MSNKQGSLEKPEVLLQVPEALLPGSREFRPVLCNHRVQTGPTGRCYLDTDLVLNSSKSQKCPEIEQTSLGVVVSPPSLKAFKYTVEDNSAVMLHRLKVTLVSKVTFTCENKACLDYGHQCDRQVFVFKTKTSKIYFDDPHVIPSSSALRKRGTLQ